jgi:hypothetical protein
MSTSSPARFLAYIALLAVCSFVAPVARAEDFAAAGTHRVETFTETWTDAARNNREVPVKV